MFVYVSFCVRKDNKTYSYGGRIYATGSAFLFVFFDECVKYWLQPELQTHAHYCTVSRLFSCSAVGAPAAAYSVTHTSEQPSVTHTSVHVKIQSPTATSWKAQGSTTEVKQSLIKNRGPEM